MGVIVRTAGDGVSFEELKWDLDYLLNLMGCHTRGKSTQEGPFPHF